MCYDKKGSTGKESNAMGEETKQLRRLVIKAYHIREAMWGEENKVEESGVLTVDKESAARYKRG